MATDKKEIIRLLRRMGKDLESVERYKRKNEELREGLRHISLQLPPMGSIRGGGSKADSIGKRAVSRERDFEKIRENEQKIALTEGRLAELVDLLFSVLTEKERAVIWMRHAEGMRWEAIAREAYISRAHCFRLEAGGMEKLSRVTLPAGYAGKEDTGKGESQS